MTYYYKLTKKEYITASFAGSGTSWYADVCDNSAFPDDVFIMSCPVASPESAEHEIRLILQIQGELIRIDD